MACRDGEIKIYTHGDGNIFPTTLSLLRISSMYASISVVYRRSRYNTATPCTNARRVSATIPPLSIVPRKKKSRKGTKAKQNRAKAIVPHATPRSITQFPPRLSLYPIHPYPSLYALFCIREKKKNKRDKNTERKRKKQESKLETERWKGGKERKAKREVRPGPIPGDIRYDMVPL